MIARHWLIAAAFSGLAWTETRAQGTATPPRFERTVTPGAAGPNHLPVDSALLIGASPLEVPGFENAPIARPGLGELRLYDDALGREVPYLFVWPASNAPTYWRGANVIPVSPRKDTSGFELDLRSAYTVDRFDVDSVPLGLLKRVRLEGSGDRVRWIVIVAEGTIFNLPPDADGRSPAMRQSVLAFPPVTVRYLRLTADDHAGAPVPPPRVASARIATRNLPESDSLRSILAVERRPSAKRTSRYHLTLPATRLPIIGLDLDVGGAQILRGARVTEPRLANGRVEPVDLGGAHLRRTTRDDATAASLRVPIRMPAGAELDLVIDDGDNPPLDLRAVRAVYAPLPYIYFESASGTPLRAAYGTDRRTPIAPPHYDLEALRDTVRRTSTAAATWGPVRASTLAAAPSDGPGVLSAEPGAPLDMKSFRVARDIPRGSGLTAVRLDAAALAHSRIDDVRILDAQGRQVPYLLERLGEPTVVPLAALAAVKARTDVDPRTLADAASWTWYRLSLPLAGLPEATLRLRTPTRVFERAITVITRELPRDALPQWAGDHAVRASWTHADPESATPPIEIALGPQRLASDSLFVLVNDGDNGTIPLVGAELLLPAFRLRFFRQSDVPLTLVYGREDLPAPRYDIQLIAPRLLDAPAVDVTAAAEQQDSGVPSRTPQLLFWVVLSAAVLVLLALVARLVRASPPSATEDVQA